jgi:large-conductance mechanosensitive channel
VFRRLTQFVLQQPQRINVLSIAAAIIMAEAIVGFVHTVGNVVATPLLLAIYSQASHNALMTREFRLGTAVETVLGALVSLALAVIAVYLIMRWSEQRSAEPEIVDESE